MQQPMNQQEPVAGQQQMSQQMVLCPVRFVYETQVLVQPGDQIQPNQTFFINTQNPPPWMQNRPAPNPVMYVQQLPNNMVPAVQQHMDQNQLYLQQNFANFQLQQHMLAQNHQEMRPTMQLTNIVPNMVQSGQQIMTNDRNTNQNGSTGQIQANTQSLIQNQINASNNRQVPNQSPINQSVEIQRTFLNVRPQVSHQVNITRPVMSLNQFQNIQPLANMQNVQMQHTNVGQTFIQNIGQRPLAQNVNTVRPQTVANNVMNVLPVAKVREVTPSEADKTISNTLGTAVPSVKNFAQNYNCRPILPRRRYLPNNAFVPKLQMQHVPVQTVQHIPVQTAPTQYNHEKSNSHQIITNIATNTTYLNNPQNPINRKRKSVSPDTIQNKIVVHPTAKSNYNPRQSVIVTKLSKEMGTNTSPVYNPNITINNVALQINPNTQMVILENAPQVNENPKSGTELSNTITPLPCENDKLLRNTVYPQARGRLLQDKISDSLTIHLIENITPESIQSSTENKTNTEVLAEKTTMIVEIQTEIVENKNMEIPIPENNPEIIETTQIETPLENENHVVEDESNVIEQMSEGTGEKSKLNDKIISKQDILTHVLDGYVIQESNFAFPIRKPLKEKTQFTNPITQESGSTDALKECMKEEMKNTSVDIPLLPFHYLLLNSNKKVGEEEIIDKVDTEKSGPFAQLQHTTVKSWTVDELSKHLLKFDWKDTVSVFQDHEIDGESLFLVSKPQLMTIGVTEEHADVICEFVRS